MAERRAPRGIADSLRPLAPLAGAWLAGTLVLGVLAAQRRIPYDELFLDPAAYGNDAWYTGLVSDLGIIGWVGAATVAAAGARVAGLDHRSAARRYLGGAALFTALLALDDLFQFHVVVTGAVHQPKAAFYALYLMLGGWWLAANWAEARRTRWPLLAAAVAALGTSVVVDQLVSPSPLELLVEDSAKFLGIIAWALYLGLTTDDVVRSVVAARRVRSAQPEEEEWAVRT